MLCLVWSMRSTVKNIKRFLKQNLLTVLLRKKRSYLGSLRHLSRTKALPSNMTMLKKRGRLVIRTKQSQWVSQLPRKLLKIIFMIRFLLVIRKRWLVLWRTRNRSKRRLSLTMPSTPPTVMVWHFAPLLTHLFLVGLTRIRPPRRRILTRLLWKPPLFPSLVGRMNVAC